MKNKTGYIIYFIISAILIGIDQLTKHFAYIKLSTGRHFSIIKNVLELTYVENTGAAWGIMAGRQWFFIIITSILSIAVVYVIFRTPATKKYISLRSILCVLLAGAVGNLIDRVANGYVKDFIYLDRKSVV